MYYDRLQKQDVLRATNHIITLCLLFTGQGVKFNFLFYCVTSSFMIDIKILLNLKYRLRINIRKVSNCNGELLTTNFVIKQDMRNKLQV